MTISQISGLFNITAGFMFVAAATLFFGGYIEYLVHMGTDVRVDGIKKMEWGVVVALVLIVILGVVKLLQGFFT